MKRYETLETLFGKVDLSFAESVVNESYHSKDSPGRPPMSPLGVFQGAPAEAVETRSKRQDASPTTLEGSAVETIVRYRGF